MSKSSKAKVKNGGGTPEVHSARSKLDGLLQTLVEKKEDSPTAEIKQEPEDYMDMSLSSTPTKKSASAMKSRKRKRGRDDDEFETGLYHHTYVMKLFDRSVDLAQFNESSTLYPICRAWMRNQPHNRNLGPRERSPTPDPDSSFDEEDEEHPDIYHLPGPVVTKMEHGSRSDLRVPSPVSQPDESLNIHADPRTIPAAEQLLLNHMVRWKEVRTKWKEAGRKNEARYSGSLTTLKEMYERQAKDQS